MDLIESLQQLAKQNFYGAAFLVAYGATWIICGVLWLRAPERTAGYATLFQGLVAFPMAMGLSLAIGAIGQERPVEDALTQLSILIGTSQLLGLPLLIYLAVKQRYALIPYAFAVICSMHFVLYTWLYQTPIYIIMAVAISIGTTVVMFAVPDRESARVGPTRTSFLTGAILLATAVLFIVMTLNG
ncbi:MAG: DUF7010 family protein [Gulosibacter sp.]|uniref:DUF7010 family protein n=1 Tax=Gulosibacter sp. TaxID=2817531 RepID=UPI003F92C9F3